jgi:hypothetical protein
MDKIKNFWKKLLKYAKHPVSPSSCGILAIINGVFAPFVYVPLSSFSGRFLTESIESISLVNRGSGILIIFLALISFLLLLKKKYLSSLVPFGISALVVIIEVYRVTVLGITGQVYKSLIPDVPFGFMDQLVVYDLTVRGRLGNALGYLVGGHIAFLFAVVMGRKQMKISNDIFRSNKKSKLRIFLYIVLILVVILVVVYFYIIASEKPIAETHINGFINRR